jgi:hypothetical protein
MMAQLEGAGRERTRTRLQSERMLLKVLGVSAAAIGLTAASRALSAGKSSAMRAGYSSHALEMSGRTHLRLGIKTSAPVAERPLVERKFRLVV